MPHTPTHAVVWLDYREAKIFLVTADDVEGKRIKAHDRMAPRDPRPGPRIERAMRGGTARG